MGRPGAPSRRHCRASFLRGRPVLSLALVGSDRAATVVAEFLGIGYGLRLYQQWRFAIEPDALYLERGVITFVETAVPFVRVQHVDTHFGPLERLLGLSSVVVYTAGSRNADVRIPGLTPTRARALQDSLRELAVESEGGDAV
ncbi:MAG: PH domain-containing protein [Natrialbaceae archaeon]|nr:PH domain-containing protein [Natrialbaceae archaeon]